MTRLTLAVLFLVGCSAEPEQAHNVWKPPELAVCSCDSSYRCMTDEDYIQMVIYGQYVKHALSNGRY